MRARSRNHCCLRKAISITYAECISVAVVIQHPMRMCSIIWSSVACLVLPYFPTLSHKWHGFRKKLLNIKSVLWFCPQRLSETFLILRRIQRDIIVSVLVPSCKVPVIMVYVLIRLEFSRHIFEKYPNIKLRENSSIGSRVVPCGQTDVMSLIVAFRNFANAP